jgi:hypothetical protein
MTAIDIHLAPPAQLQAIVRFVAGLAGKAAGVLVGVDLGEAGRLGGAGRMTSDADDGGIEFGGHDRGVVGVILQRTMTSLAVDMLMFARLLGFGDVGMAGLAGGVPGEVEGLGRDLCDGGSTVVPILAEAFGDDEVANHQEDSEGDDEQEGKPEEMCYILEPTHRTWVSFRG